MKTSHLKPTPPRWALEAGLPAPRPRESFRKYVTRLGFDADELLVGLNERTLPLANGRLAAAIQYASPEAFSRYLRERRYGKLCEWCGARIEPEEEHGRGICASVRVLY
jgi:hypothetical protein